MASPEFIEKLRKALGLKSVDEVYRRYPGLAKPDYTPGATEASVMATPAPSPTH